MSKGLGSYPTPLAPTLNPRRCKICGHVHIMSDCGVTGLDREKQFHKQCHCGKGGAYNVLKPFDARITSPSGVCLDHKYASPGSGDYEPSCKICWPDGIYLEVDGVRSYDLGPARCADCRWTFVITPKGEVARVKFA
jgi:hypothetical protein